MEGEAVNLGAGNAGRRLLHIPGEGRFVLAELERRFVAGVIDLPTYVLALRQTRRKYEKEVADLCTLIVQSECLVVGGLETVDRPD